MAVFDFIGPMGSVAQMPQPNLAREGHVFLKPPGILCLVFISLKGLPKLLGYFLEDIRYGSLTDGPIAADVAASGGYIKFDIGNAGSVLAPIYLLFHQQIKLICPIKGRTILIDIILVRFAEPDKGNAALMFDGVAHEGGAEAHLFLVVSK
jgi:hypothetical protein